MKIIALIGKDKCGKTETLTTVYFKILDNKGDSTCRKTEGNPIFKDFSDIVKYKGLRVAFFTMGDYSTITTKIIKEYNALNVDVLILASNTKFVKPIELIKKHNNELINKTITTTNKKNQKTKNDSDANRIFGLI
ncbi:hypothetical protein NLG42_20320 [Flavobacterium plurextorum]|uniref:hypothetical protein n=1 Tax=Flavobacterium TaxID=237 RepID=UPI00214D354C|nr:MULTISPECIES: hypothetical protein [Flavobacterium]UUW08442.1 hypothetical protein NLG42_20320 [Flavobacterium plurextorum]